MFDLESQIRAWRQQAAQSLGDEPGALDELESHLREEFDRLVGAGQAPQNAWDEALSKMGQPEKLAEEFAKLRRRHWLPAWVASAALALCVMVVAWFVFSGIASGRLTLLLGTHIVFVTAGYVAVFAIGCLGIYASLIRSIKGWNDRQDAVFRKAGTRLAVLVVIATFVGTMLGAWRARDHLGRWWGWDAKEIGGLCVLTWGGILLQAFRAKEASAQARICLAIVANVVVAVSWFGPFLLGGTHSYGYPSTSVGMLLGPFLIMQMLLVYLTLLPAGALSVRRHVVR